MTNVDNEQMELDIPAELPILPLRGVVVYPMMWLPLTVGQERSIRLVDDALVDSSQQRIIGLFTSRDTSVEEPAPNEVYEVGTAAVVHRMLRAPDGTIRLIVQGIERIRTTGYLQEQPYLRANVEVVPDTEEESLEQEALMRTTLDLFRRLVALVPHMPEELETAAINAQTPRQLAYLVAASTRMEPEQAQEILEIDPVAQKLIRLNSILAKELEVLELGRKIQTQAQDEMTKMQREYFLREQLKAIQKELGEGDEQEAEIQDYERRIDEVGMPAEAEKEARRELDRMRKMPTQAAEYTVIKTYLDWMVNLPWSTNTPDNLDIAHARAGAG
jgi:ATP-dependent Lon protease